MATKHYYKHEFEYAVMQSKDDLTQAWQHLNNFLEGIQGSKKISKELNHKLTKIQNSILKVLEEVDEFAEVEIYKKQEEEEKKFNDYLKQIDADIEALK